ncbi:MAG: AbrB/MazE/SpoVT family DNA-binding domain-containing protein [Candidatus Bathyarchaeia archaeon]|jgi:AbrB family looped-hinge helix DNA binding protein
MVGYNFIILRAKNVESIVKVTRRGQTTIPVKIREQCGIKEGDQLLVEVTEKGILFKPIPKLEDMAGIDAKYGTPEEINKKIDKLREEY